jgi:hypothetical protein
MRRDFYEPDEPVEDVIAAFEHGIKHLTEKVRREIANKHRDEVVEGSGRPVRPKRLDSIHSVRFSSDEAAELGKAAERMGLSGLSSLLREAARKMVEPIGFRCDHMAVSCGGGFVSFRGACGCQMQPVWYAA